MLGRTLDRYIAGHFLRYYLYALAAFVAIYLVVNFIETVGKFLQKGTDVGTIASYYLYMIPFVVKWVNPIAVLLGVLFCISILGKGSEITAMKASGVSLYRVFAPLVVLGTLIGVGVWVFGETVVPYANERCVAIKKWVFDGLDREAMMKVTDYSTSLSGNLILYTGQMDAYNGRMSRPTLISFDPETPELAVERVDAAVGEYLDGEWHFYDCEVRTFGPEGQELTLVDVEEMVVPITEAPGEFAIEARTPEDMTYGELSAHIERMERAGKDPAKERVELDLKVSVPLANLIVILIGAPLAIRTARSGTALGFGMAVLLGFILWGFIAVGRAFGQRGVISPFVAAFLPNILFGLAGLVLIRRVNR
ncbi:MAG: LptF/LptG family permease [bacterium]|nr:LptF/LptG family permease [bacterium]